MAEFIDVFTLNISIYNTIYIIGRELVHVFAGGIILTCVNKAYIPRIAIAIFPKNKAANRDARAVEKVCRQTNYGVEYIQILN